MVLTSLTKTCAEALDFLCGTKISQSQNFKILNVDVPSRWVASSLSLLTTPMRSRFSLSVSSTRFLRWSRSETDDDCELVNEDICVSKSLFDVTKERGI